MSKSEHDLTSHSGMIFLFALFFVVSEGSLSDILGYRKCTKVNGITGACNLHLNYFTLAGSVTDPRFGILVTNIGFLLPNLIQTKVANALREVPDQKNRSIVTLIFCSTISCKKPYISNGPHVPVK